MVLSVCIPTYNRLSYLLKLLDKLIPEILPIGMEVELLVSENYSTEANRVALMRHHNRNSNSYILFQHDQNIGAIENIYFLLSKASGQYILFFSDDDLIVANTFSRICDVIKEYAPNCIYVNYSSFVNSTENIIKTPDITPFDGFHPNGMEIFSILTKKNGEIFMFISSMVYKRDVLLEYTCNIESWSLVDPLKFSIFCAQHDFYLISDSLIFQRSYNASWNDQGISIFAWQVQTCIMDCEFILGRENVRDLVISLYKKNNNFVHVWKAPLLYKIKLIDLLKMNVLFLFFSSSFFYMKRVFRLIGN